MDVFQALLLVAERQHGLITRAQALVKGAHRRDYPGTAEGGGIGAGARRGLPGGEIWKDLEAVVDGSLLAGVTVHRVSHLPSIDVVWLDHIPVTSATRTVIDLAGVLTRKDLAEVLDHALAVQKFPLAYLQKRCAALGTRGPARERRPGLAHRGAGRWSKEAGERLRAPAVQDPEGGRVTVA